MKNNNNEKTYIIPVFIPFQGCKQRCIYCNQKIITKEDFCGESFFDNVKKQLELWKERLKDRNISEVAYYGGTFTRLESALRKKLYELAEPYDIRVSTSPECISDDFLEELEQYPIKTVELGVQSLDNNVLELNKRSYKENHVYEAFNKLKKVTKSAQFMTGMFRETRESILYTAEAGSKLGAEFYRIYPTLVLKSTKLATYFESKEFAPVSPAETLLRATWLFINFTAAGGKVIRMGLPSDIDETDILSGFWHPAFGDMIKTLTVAAFAIRFEKLPNMDFIGYKALIAKKFKLQQDAYVDTMQKTALKLKEHFGEGEQWFTEEQIVGFACRLVG